MKAIQIKFFDNDFCSAAKGAVEALALTLDLTTTPKAFILDEFKSLIFHLANTHYRTGEKGYNEVPAEYWDSCTIKSLDYIPKEWNNSESIVYNFETGEVTIL